MTIYSKIEYTREWFDNPNLKLKETSSKQSLGESEVSNNQHQVEGSEATSVSLAGDEGVVKNETNSPVKNKLKCIKCKTELQTYINGVTYCPKCQKIRIGGLK
jgi:hypothetical protein